MAYLDGAVTGAIMVLFGVVGGLLVYGGYAFRHAGPAADVGRKRVDTRREVIWTALAAVLLLVIAWYVR